MVDAQGQIQLVNRQVESWFRYARNELLGQMIENLVPDNLQRPHVAWREKFMQEPSVRQLGVGKNLKARRKDGTEFPCDISLHPLPTDQGMQVLVHIVDITERERIETERRQQESHRRLRFMVDNLPAGAVYILGDTIQVNRATEEITGYSRQELNTLDRWFSVLFRERSTEMRSRYSADREAHFPHTRMWEIIRKDGQPRWVEQTAFLDEDDEVWMLHDVTDRMRAQQQVVQAERLAAIGQMMTALAHESRNALQRAQACLEMLELDLEDRPELRNLAGRAQTAVDELQRLYEEVRGYATPLVLELHEWNLQAICEEVWNNISPAHAQQHIEFHSGRNQDSPVCRVDRHRFGQVLRNVLDNSLSVLPTTGGQIRVTFSVDPADSQTWFRISIHDNGPGLTPEQRVRIFEPFYTTKARGTGLGMAISKRIMEAHGGNIVVGDTTTGTEVVLFLPK